MYINDTAEIFSYIQKHPEFSILVADTIEITDLLIQDLNRDVGGQTITFIALRNIKVHPKYANKNLFIKIIKALSNTHRPLLLDNIINDKIFNVCKRMGFEDYSYVKNGEYIKCLLKLQG